MWWKKKMFHWIISFFDLLAALEEKSAGFIFWGTRMFSSNSCGEPTDIDIHVTSLTKK